MSATPPPPPTPAKYLGCFHDLVNGQRDLPFNAGDEPNDDGPAICGAKCHTHEYFGLQDKINCFCGDAAPAQGKAPETDCNMPCPGDTTSGNDTTTQAVMCGGVDRNSVYRHTVEPAPPVLPVPTASFSSDLQPAQMQRLNMSQALVHGRWNTWAKGSVTAHILLPAGIMLKFGLCELSSGSCKEDGEKVTWVQIFQPVHHDSCRCSLIHVSNCRCICHSNSVPICN